MKLGAQHLERAWNDKAEDFEARLQRYTQTTVQQIDALSHIAEGFAMRNDGKTEVGRINLVSVLQDVVYLHDSQGVQFSTTHNVVHVSADRTRLTRAFNNLVQNALESSLGKEVKVGVDLSVQDNQAVVEVSDNGDGIAKGRLERIFEPKFTTKTHGLGLGLAMAPLCTARRERSMWTPQKAMAQASQSPSRWRHESHQGIEHRAADGSIVVHGGNAEVKQVHAVWRT